MILPNFCLFLLFSRSFFMSHSDLVLLPQFFQVHFRLRCLKCLFVFVGRSWHRLLIGVINHPFSQLHLFSSPHQELSDPIYVSYFQISQTSSTTSFILNWYWSRSYMISPYHCCYRCRRFACGLMNLCLCRRDQLFLFIFGHCLSQHWFSSNDS